MHRVTNCAPQMAQRIAKDLEAGTGQYPFQKIVWCNIGNPQILGQKPITYFRQVLALCECPQVGGACTGRGCRAQASARLQLTAVASQ